MPGSHPVLQSLVVRPRDIRRSRPGRGREETRTVTTGEVHRLSKREENQTRRNAFDPENANRLGQTACVDLCGPLPPTDGDRTPVSLGLKSQSRRNETANGCLDRPSESHTFSGDGVCGPCPASRRSHLLRRAGERKHVANAVTRASHAITKILRQDKLPDMVGLGGVSLGD